METTYFKKGLPIPVGNVIMGGKCIVALLIIKALVGLATLVRAPRLDCTLPDVVDARISKDLFSFILAQTEFLLSIHRRDPSGPIILGILYTFSRMYSLSTSKAAVRATLNISV